MEPSIKDEIDISHTIVKVISDSIAWGDGPMECLLCHQKIKTGQHIFVGATAIFVGPGEDDLDSVGIDSDLGGVIHRSCLESPVEATRTPDTATPEPIVEESVVTRSDALSLLR